MVAAVKSLVEECGTPILYSMHSRARDHVERRGTVFRLLVRSHKPFGFHDYVALQKSARCAVSDSGTLAEEAAILGFPAVSLCASTGRPEVADRGVFTLGFISAERLLQAVVVETALAGRESQILDHGDERVSSKIAKTIQVYTGYVSKWVWRK